MQTETQIGAQFIPKLVKHRIERRIRSGTVVYMKRNASTRKPKMNELKLSSILIFNLSLFRFSLAHPSTSNQKRKTESRNYLQLISAFQSINKTATSNNSQLASVFFSSLFFQRILPISHQFYLTTQKPASSVGRGPTPFSFSLACFISLLSCFSFSSVRWDF